MQSFSRYGVPAPSVEGGSFLREKVSGMSRRSLTVEVRLGNASASLRGALSLHRAVNAATQSLCNIVPDNLCRV